MSGVKVSGQPWRVFKVGELACRRGCEKVAIAIQKAIGGTIKTIHANGLRLGGIRNIGGSEFVNPAGRGYAWFHHKVVVKNGRVYDALTGPNGQTIAAYKARWQYSDAIDFGF